MPDRDADPRGLPLRPPVPADGPDTGGTGHPAVPGRTGDAAHRPTPPTPDRSARDWAARADPGTPVRWRALEVAAFTGHRAVQRALDPSARYRPRPSRPVRVLGGIGLALVLIVVVLAVLLPSVAGLLVLVAVPRHGDHPYLAPATAVPTAGWVFLFSLLTLVASLVSWIRAGRRPDGMRVGQAVVAIITGVVATPAAAVRGSGDDVGHWQLWTIAIGVHTVFAIAFVAMLVAARLAQLRAGDDRPDRPASAEPLRGVRRAVDRLSPADRHTVRADLDAAVDVLVERDLVTAADATRARDADLGMLALHMSQHPRHGQRPTGASSETTRRQSCRYRPRSAARRPRG